MTKLEKTMELDKCEYSSDYIVQFFCPKCAGFTSPCLMTSGLKDCIKHWNEEVTKKDPGFKKIDIDGGDLREE